jgi:DNA polymerase I-like protein with 3'-5' exonuclease and polymerase domains
VTEVCFVFASTAEKEAKKTIDKYLKNVEYDVKYLSSQPKEKILKKDVDLDLAELSGYKITCPIGADALKYVAGMTGIQKYNGVFVEKKYLPIMHPNIILIKPQIEDDIKKAFNQIPKLLTGENLGVEIEKDYCFVETEQQFQSYKQQLDDAAIIVADIETTSVSPFTGTILGVALSTKAHQGIYVSAEIVQKHKNWFYNLFKTKKVIFHNAKFDMGFMAHEYGFEFPDFEDTMLLHYCLEESVGTHGLKPLAMRFTDLGDYERDLDEYKKTWARKNKVKLEDFNYGMLPSDILAPYACKDADATFQLFSKFMPLVDKSPEFTKLYRDILIPATYALRKLEKNGGPVDRAQVEWLANQYEIDVEECLAEIANSEAVARFERIHGKIFNPNSTAQLRELFFNILNIKPTKKTETGAWSVDKEVLKEIDHPLAEAILDLREKSKMAGTYISNIRRGIDYDDRLRSGFNIHGTTSGRLSSSGTLNYQNIPRDNKDIKKLFRARPGYKIVQCDLGTAEVYYAAVLSADKFLQQAFIDKLDFHSYVAKQMFNLPCEVKEVKKLYPNERQYAKAITFGIMYQAGPAKIAETVNKDAKAGEEISVSQAKQFINKYFNEAKALKRFIDASNDQIENYAYIYAFFGRKRRLPEAKAPNPGVAKHAIRSGVNFLVQSVASDINVLGLIDLIKWVETNGYDDVIKPFTVVHDSIVSEVREDLVPLYIENARRCIQTDRGLSIPNCPIKVDFEIGDSWGELENEKEYLEQIS